ncbi:MAG: formyltransferase family protein [Promethearchaeota archaeon]
MISDDVIFKPRVLFRILQNWGGSVCGVAEVGYKKSKKKMKTQRISDLQFWGLGPFLMLGLYSYLLRFVSRLALPSFIQCKLSNKNVCSFFNISYEYVTDVNDPNFIKNLRSKEPDIIISFQRQIFSENLLGVAKIACLNCHPAELPNYRGFRPIFSAMLNGEKSIGITVHTMTKEIDKGAIICQKSFPSSNKYSLMDNYNLAHEIYSDVMLEAIDLIEKKGISDFPLIPKDAEYYKYPSREDVIDFRARGLKMV